MDYKAGDAYIALPTFVLVKICEINDVPVGLTWYNEVKLTKEQVLSQRH